VRAAAGQLTYLQWDDITCNACGGLVSKQCIITSTAQPQHSCASARRCCCCCSSVTLPHADDPARDTGGLFLQAHAHETRCWQGAASFACLPVQSC
jgi:hypothetical protein